MTKDPASLQSEYFDQVQYRGAFDPVVSAYAEPKVEFISACNNAAWSVGEVALRYGRGMFAHFSTRPRIHALRVLQMTRNSSNG